MEGGRDTKGREVYFPSRRCQRRAGGCWGGRAGSGKPAANTSDGGQQFPVWQLPPSPASTPLLACGECVFSFVPTPFSSLPSLNVRPEFSRFAYSGLSTVPRPPSEPVIFGPVTW